MRTRIDHHDYINIIYTNSYSVQFSFIYSKVDISKPFKKSIAIWFTLTNFNSIKHHKIYATTTFGSTDSIHGVSYSCLWTLDILWCKHNSWFKITMLLNLKDWTKHCNKVSGENSFTMKKKYILNKYQYFFSIIIFQYAKICVPILRYFLWYWKVFTAIYFSNLQQIKLWNLIKVGFEALRAYVRFDFGNVFVLCSFRLSIWMYLQLKKKLVNLPLAKFLCCVEHFGLPGQLFSCKMWQNSNL